MVNYHSGILEGVAGRLGLARPGEKDPPRLAQEGVSRCYEAALSMLCEAKAGLGEEGTSLGSKTLSSVDGGLHTGYESDFISRRACDVHPIFRGPILPGLVAKLDSLRLNKPAKPTEV